jgi:hypothetical protein
VKDIRPDVLARMELRARMLAKAIHGVIDPQRLRQVGFTLILFSYDGSESTYVSSAKRDDMIKFLDEMLIRLRSGTVAPHGAPTHKANRPGKA